MPKDEKEIVLPNHIRIFMDDALINSLSSQNTTHNNNNNNNNNNTNTEEEEEVFPTKAKEGKEFYKEAMEKGRSVCWSKKGLVDHNTVEEKWKYDRHVLDNNNNNINNNEKDNEVNDKKDNNNYSDEQVELFAEEEEEIKSDSREIKTWEEAKEIFKECSVVLGLHPDQATEAIVDFALKWDKPFAVLPCCVYHKEFPKRRFPDGSPISRYEDFVQYLIAKDPENIRQALLDIEGKNIILYKTQNTPTKEK